MSPSVPDRADVTVIGAGTAGAATAALCAARGLQVVCLDARPLERAGAHWCNGVVARDFLEAGIELPEGPERLAENARFHLVAGNGPSRVTITDHGVLEVDMQRLVTRLQQLARDRGAQLRGNVRALGREDTLLTTSAGTIRSRWIVDASGLRGARFLLPRPEVPPAHLCTAAQHVHAVRDPAAAEAFFASHGAAGGEVLCFTGVEGGYSILNLRCDPDWRHLSILTGSVPGGGRRSGSRILADFVDRHRWVGEHRRGGQRALPIRRPLDRLAHGAVAAIGDAGCQVFPAHGSGIGAGLVAARMLADTAASGGTPHDYAVTWQRSRGGLFAAYDLFRRMSQTLAVTDLASLMDGGLMDPDLARAGLAQELPRPRLRQLPRLGVGALRAPRLAARLAATATKMTAVRALYAMYPRAPDELPRWSQRVAALFGEPADPS